MQKKIIILFLFFSFDGFSQISTNKETYKNEFGIDATSFILRFLKFNFTEEQYIQTYYLTYRRNFIKGNIRSGLGGNFISEVVRSVYVDDSNSYQFNSYNLNLRLGWEWKSELSKKWQVYYGVDFRPSYLHTKDDAENWNGGYANGYELNLINFGIAPVIGFRFRLNSRMSLLTETSFSFNYQKEKLRNYYTPVTSSFPAKTDVNYTPVKRVFTSLGQPLMIFLTFDI